MFWGLAISFMLTLTVMQTQFLDTAKRTINDEKNYLLFLQLTEFITKPSEFCSIDGRLNKWFIILFFTILILIIGFNIVTSIYSLPMCLCRQICKSDRRETVEKHERRISFIFFLILMVNLALSFPFYIFPMFSVFDPINGEYSAVTKIAFVCRLTCIIIECSLILISVKEFRFIFLPCLLIFKKKNGDSNRRKRTTVEQNEEKPKRPKETREKKRKPTLNTIDDESDSFPVEKQKDRRKAVPKKKTLDKQSEKSDSVEETMRTEKKYSTSRKKKISEEQSRIRSNSDQEVSSEDSHLIKKVETRPLPVPRAIKTTAIVNENKKVQQRRTPTDSETDSDDPLGFPV